MGLAIVGHVDYVERPFIEGIEGIIEIQHRRCSAAELSRSRGFLLGSVLRLFQAAASSTQSGLDGLAFATLLETDAEAQWPQAGDEAELHLEPLPCFRRSM